MEDFLIVRTLLLRILLFSMIFIARFAAPLYKRLI